MTNYEIDVGKEMGETANHPLFAEATEHTFKMVLGGTNIKVLNVTKNGVVTLDVPDVLVGNDELAFKALNEAFPAMHKVGEPAPVTFEEEDSCTCGCCDDEDDPVYMGDDGLGDVLLTEDAVLRILEVYIRDIHTIQDTEKVKMFFQDLGMIYHMSPGEFFPKLANSVEKKMIKDGKGNDPMAMGLVAMLKDEAKRIPTRANKKRHAANQVTEGEPKNLTDLL